MLTPRLACGSHHTVCVSANGVAYVWGGGSAVRSSEHDTDDDGCLPYLGLGAEHASPVPRPLPIPLNIRVRSCAAGPQHTLLLTEDGGVYSMGCGRYGRLGHGNELAITSPRRIARLGGNPGQPSGDASTADPAVRVFAGGSHSMVLGASGRLYSFGSGVNGRHGHGEASNQWLPRWLEGPLSAAVVRDAAAGVSHSLAITSDGVLYTWGAGGSGQLGLGRVPPEYLRRTPTYVEHLRDVPIVRASVGTAHTLAISASGELYSFGFGVAGRLGHGHREDVHVPSRVEGLAGRRVCAAIAADEHSVALTEEGQVYTFGGNARGRLGLGAPLPAPALPPRVCTVLERHLSTAAAAEEAKAQVMSTFAFGRERSGRYGQPTDLIAIGRGRDESALLPRAVGGLHKIPVVEIAAGSHHTLVCLAGGEVRACGAHELLGRPWLADDGADSSSFARVELPPPSAVEVGAGPPAS